MTVERRAPTGKWRVIALNPSTENEWLIDDCGSQTAAISRMNDEAKDDTSLAFFVYDDSGECVSRAGWKSQAR